MKVRFIFLILICSNLVESSDKTQISQQANTTCGFNTASTVLPQIYQQAAELFQELNNAVDVFNTINSGGSPTANGGESTTVPCVCKSASSSSSSSSTPCSTWSVPTFDYSFLAFSDFALASNPCLNDIPATYSPFGAC